MGRAGVAGGPDAGEFSVWYLEGGGWPRALSVGRSEDLAHARPLIESGADVSARGMRWRTRTAIWTRSGSANRPSESLT